MAERLAAGNVAIALLCNSLATGAMLYVLITVLAPNIWRSPKSRRHAGFSRSRFYRDCISLRVCHQLISRRSSRNVDRAHYVCGTNLRGFPHRVVYLAVVRLAVDDRRGRAFKTFARCVCLAGVNARLDGRVAGREEDGSVTRKHHRSPDPRVVETAVFLVTLRTSHSRLCYCYRTGVSGKCQFP
jgi:hypothetical protein